MHIHTLRGLDFVAIERDGYPSTGRVGAPLLEAEALHAAPRHLALRRALPRLARALQAHGAHGEGAGGDGGWLEAGGHHLTTQLVDACEDFLLAFGRGLLESVDVVAQQRGVDADESGKFGHIDFLMGEEEALHGRRLAILIDKALEADVLIKPAPVYAAKAEGVFGTLGIGGSPPLAGLSSVLSVFQRYRDLAFASAKSYLDALS